jgi:hypothetical protein
LRLRIHQAKYQESIAISNFACNIECEWGFACKDRPVGYYLSVHNSGKIYLQHHHWYYIYTYIHTIYSFFWIVDYLWWRYLKFLNSILKAGLHECQKIRPLHIDRCTGEHTDHNPKATHLNVCMLLSVWARSCFWIGVSTLQEIFPHPLFNVVA